MSVINTMLRDLEQRQQLDTPPKTKIRSPQQREHPEDQAHRTLQILLILSLLLCAIASGLYTYSQHHASTLHKTQDLHEIHRAWQVIQIPKTHKMDYPYPLTSKFILKYAFPTTTENQTQPIKVEPKQTVQVHKPKPIHQPPQPINRSSAASKKIAKKPSNLRQVRTMESQAQTHKALQPKIVQASASTRDPAQTVPLPNQPIAVQSSEVQPLVKPISQTIVKNRDIQISEAILTPQEQNKKAMQQAALAEQKGDIEQAIYYYQVALKALPDHHIARHALATLWVAQHNYDQAEFVLKQGILLYPEQTNMSFTLAKLQIHRGHTQQALNTLVQLKTKTQDRLQHLYLQSKLAHTLQKFDIAEQSYKELVKLQPHQGRWWFGLAFALDSQQEYHRAIIAYQHAIRQKNLSQKAKKYAQNRIETLFRILQGST